MVFVQDALPCELLGCRYRSSYLQLVSPLRTNDIVLSKMSHALIPSTSPVEMQHLPVWIQYMYQMVVHGEPESENDRTPKNDWITGLLTLPEERIAWIVSKWYHKINEDLRVSRLMRKDFMPNWIVLKRRIFRCVTSQTRCNLGFPFYL